MNYDKAVLNTSEIVFMKTRDCYATLIDSALNVRAELVMLIVCGKQRYVW